MNNFIFKLFKTSEINLSRQSNNFDFLRLFAASLVLISHSPYILTGSSLPWDPISELFGISMGSFGVIIFFIISGFLVTMSWQKKKNTFDFVAARILRIYPAAIVIVLLCVFILGPIITTKTFYEYLTGLNTHLYLKNMTIFRVYYYLPGVFELNPTASVNGSFWTLPYEFTCYIFLGVFGILMVLRKKTTILILFGILLLIEIFLSEEIRKIIIPILGIDFKTFYPLFLYFISGSVFYLLRENIPFNFPGAIAASIIIYIFNDSSFTQYLLWILLPYIILCIAFYKSLGMQNIGKLGDVSYGLYLYAFPVQQLIVSAFYDRISLFGMICLSFLFTLPLAYLSWQLIEKPALKLRWKLKCYYD